VTFKPGHVKIGGRKAGVPNKATVVREQEVLRIVAEATAGNLPAEDAVNATPLEAMLICMRWALAERDRAGVLAAATAAAPYMHPRLSSSDVRISATLDSKSDADIAAELAEVQAKLAAARVLN
jgi:hypothetical protein